MKQKNAIRTLDKLSNAYVRVLNEVSGEEQLVRYDLGEDFFC